LGVASITSAVRAFCPGYFPHFASGLEPRHIGARPKGTPFWPRLSPEAIDPVLCLGSVRTEAIGDKYFFLIQIFIGHHGRLNLTILLTHGCCRVITATTELFDDPMNPNMQLRWTPTSE